jgi:hypothetical protein
MKPFRSNAFEGHSKDYLNKNTVTVYWMNSEYLYIPGALRNYRYRTAPNSDNILVEQAQEPAPVLNFQWLLHGKLRLEKTVKALLDFLALNRTGTSKQLVS